MFTVKKHYKKNRFWLVKTLILKERFRRKRKWFTKLKKRRSKYKSIWKKPSKKLFEKLKRLYKRFRRRHPEKRKRLIKRKLSRLYHNFLKTKKMLRRTRRHAYRLLFYRKLLAYKRRRKQYIPQGLFDKSTAYLERDIRLYYRIIKRRKAIRKKALKSRWQIRKPRLIRVLFINYFVVESSFYGLSNKIITC